MTRVISPTSPSPTARGTRYPLATKITRHHRHPGAAAGPRALLRCHGSGFRDWTLQDAEDSATRAHGDVDHRDPATPRPADGNSHVRTRSAGGYREESRGARGPSLTERAASPASRPGSSRLSGISATPRAVERLDPVPFDPQ